MCDQIKKSFREADSALEVTDPAESSASDLCTILINALDSPESMKI